MNSAEQNQKAWFEGLQAGDRFTVKYRAHVGPDSLVRFEVLEGKKVRTVSEATLSYNGGTTINEFKPITGPRADMRWQLEFRPSRWPNQYFGVATKGASNCLDLVNDPEWG